MSERREYIRLRHMLDYAREAVALVPAGNRQTWTTTASWSWR